MSMKIISMSVRMLFILFLCPVLLASVLTLTIDSQLGTSIEDCFERVSIGEQLPSDAIYRNVSELTTKECEHICKQDKQCQTYDYGVGAKGNATCDLSKIDEKELKEKSVLQKHPDYDVYVRRFQCEQSPPLPLQPQFDDPGDGPQHRPVFRPEDADEKRPTPDFPLLDYGYETHRPKPYPSNGYRPQRPGRPFNNYIENERPDDFDNSKPDYDRPPSYGAHKPQDIPYRPERPPAYGIFKPQDIPYRPERPPSYGDHKPQDIPFNPERPPTYGNHKPQDIPYRPERPPTYGDHKPQDIPFNPERPPTYGDHKPQDIPYRPERPHTYGDHKPQDIPYRPVNHTYKPDPYDVLQFQEPYGRPRPPPNSFRPDPYYPSRPNDEIPDLYGQKPVKPETLRPEHPQYVYIIRPNRKPYHDQQPQEDSGYGHKPVKPEFPAYGQNDVGQTSGPIGPPSRPYRPRPIYDSSKPNDKPSYSYNEQYASNYGANSNQDNSIYVEIYDPPRPYKPLYTEKPNSGGIFGYGTQSYGSHYSQNSQSTSSYGQTQTPSYGQNRPIHDTKPQKPSYGSAEQSDQADSSYGPQKPYGNKPSYASQSHDQSYGSQNNFASQAAYGESHSGSQYGSSASLDSQGYGNSQKGQTQSHGSQFNSQYGSQASYGSSQYGSQSYGGSSFSDSGYGQHGSVSNQYGSAHSSNQAAYGTQSSQQYGSGSSQASYGSQSDSQASYGSQSDSQQHQSSYNQHGSGIQSDHASYGQTGSSHHGHGIQSTQSYGHHQNDYDNAGYSQQSSNRPAYGSNQASSSQYDAEPGYGSSSQGSYKPSSNRPGYGSNQEYLSQQDADTGYGTSKGSFNRRPTYGGNQGSSSQMDTSYGSNNQGSQSSNSGYNRPPYNDEKPGFNRPGGNKTGYDSNKPDHKPVYEFDLDKPADVPSYLVGPNGEIVTSRPVVIGDYEAPGYGRNPGGELTYKACFRRVLAGRRALRSHVRKVLRCEHLEDCRRECALEKHFHCESFNYRLDPSFRGKGLCELMTKPIEAFNLHQDFVDDKDYDFYELDRNSLEPNCLDTLRGPGHLHSGYLSSKQGSGAHDRWSDRADWGYNGYKYQEDRRAHQYSNRRYEDQFYVPYQIGISRTNDDENWGQYGGVYGGYDTYYKDRNDYHKSINHWRLAEERAYDGVKSYDINAKEQTYHGVKPYSANTNFNYHSLAKSRSWDGSSYGYGSWKRGWSSIGSGNTLEYDLKPSKHYWIEAEDRSDDEPVKDCSSRRRAGMSLGAGAIRRSLYARNVVECETACFSETEFKCVSYSYRYSGSIGIDNCFLSERPYKGLEMSADSGSDVYAMPQDQGCETISKKPWIESECFWHVRSGAAVSGSAVRASLTVTGLGACEAECIRAHTFFCRGFSFRFEAPSIGDDIENCVLTSTPPTSLDTGRGLRPTVGHELYARGNYGRGCEPALYDDVHYRDTQCYLKYDNAAKLTGTAVRGQARVKDEQACGAICTEVPFTCLSFSFRSTAAPDTDNCLLSEIRLFDLQRGVDYEHSTEDWLFAFDLFNGQCWRKVHGKEHDIPSLEVPRPLSALPPAEHYPPSSPDVPPPVIETYISSGSTGPGFPSAPELPLAKPYAHERPFRPYPPETGPSAPSGPDYKPSYPPVYLDSKPPISPYPPSSYDKPYRPPEYDSKPRPYPELRPNYKPFLPTAPSGFKPGYPPQPPLRPYPEPIPTYPAKPNRPIYGDREDNEIISSWRHYTVSGFPCRKGTTCAQNQVAGHWACEPEGGEIGSWDYCCAPTHRCGYSEGFQKPWCYVGPENDQWRPCSEKYYPYHQHKVPHPSLGHRDEKRPSPSRPHRERPGYGDRDRFIPGPYLSDADRKYWDDLYKNGPQAYYDKYGNPLPGYTRVPTEERPYIKYRHNNLRPGSGTWIPVPVLQDDQPPGAGELGVPRYWPVAYLHKGPPPNMTYFRYNETSFSNERFLTSGSENSSSESKFRNINKANENALESRTIEDDDDDDYVAQQIRNEMSRKNTTENSTTQLPCKSEQVTTTQKSEVKETTSEAIKEFRDKIETTTEFKTAENIQTEKESDVIHGIDDKLHDFTTSIEIFDIEDAKTSGKASELKTVEAEERQIEAIGRLLASRRGNKVVLEKRSEKDLENKKIAVDKDLVDFNFGNKFATNERRGKVQKVSKDDIEKEKLGNDKSLEVSETTFVRPPRVLSTTENIRKAIVNGKVFYDATIRDQRDLFSNSTRKPKNLRLEESRGPSVITNTNGKKKTIRARNINPIRRVRRVYRKRYNPEEVRKRLLEREKNKTNTEGIRT